MEKQKGLSVQELHELSLSRNISDRVVAAQSPYCNYETFDRLSRDSQMRVVKEVAKNPHTPKEILARLSRSKFFEIQKALASNNYFLMLEKNE